jgi:hypothetical protein
MSQRRFFILTLLFMSLMFWGLAPAPAQTENKVAQKFDDFGDILYSDLIARLDNFAIQLTNNTNAKGFLIAYRTRRDLPGLSHAMAMRMKAYLVKTRGISRDRVAIVDGGVAWQLAQELWIVPPGTTPTPRSDARIGYFQNPDSAWKFYERGFLPLNQHKRFGIQADPEAEIEELEAYANELKKRPSQSACIIVYAQFNRRRQMADWAGTYEPLPEVHLDEPGTARKELSRRRDYLIRVYGIPPSKIRMLDGGYRKQRSIEFWIVPAGEPLPIPTPNSFPKRRRK